MYGKVQNIETVVKKHFHNTYVLLIELFHLHGYKFKLAILLNRFNARKYCRKCESIYFAQVHKSTTF